jgi:hypothetical protein
LQHKKTTQTSRNYYRSGRKKRREKNTMKGKPLHPQIWTRESLNRGEEESSVLTRSVAGQEDKST